MCLTECVLFTEGHLVVELSFRTIVLNKRIERVSETCSSDMSWPWSVSFSFLFFRSKYKCLDVNVVIAGWYPGRNNNSLFRKHRSSIRSSVRKERKKEKEPTRIARHTRVRCSQYKKRNMDSETVSHCNSVFQCLSAEFIQSRNLVDLVDPRYWLSYDMLHIKNILFCSLSFKILKSVQQIFCFR